MSSPANAFIQAFRIATEEVRFSKLNDDEAELARLATAFRNAGAATIEWCQQRLGWTTAEGWNLEQAFTLAAGGWVLAGIRDVDVLDLELTSVWQEFLVRRLG